MILYRISYNENVQFTIIALRKLVIPWKSSHVIDAAMGQLIFVYCDVL